MFFLFSGEGPTDLGGCSNPIDYCQGEEYRYGPMTVVVDQIVFALHQYSLLELSAYGFVPKGTLMARASELKVVKKSLRLPGAKTPKETRYFFNNARVLSRIALELQTELDDEVVADAVVIHDPGTTGPQLDGRSGVVRCVAFDECSVSLVGIDAFAPVVVGDVAADDGALGNSVHLVPSRADGNRPTGGAEATVDIHLSGFRYLVVFEDVVVPDGIEAGLVRVSNIAVADLAVPSDQASALSGRVHDVQSVDDDMVTEHLDQEGPLITGYAVLPVDDGGCARGSHDRHRWHLGDVQ